MDNSAVAEQNSIFQTRISSMENQPPYLRTSNNKRTQRLKGIEFVSYFFVKLIKLGKRAK